MNKEHDSNYSHCPFISVVMPVYNKRPHLRRSICSVLNQQYRNFELIIVNDASTDGSEEIIHSFHDARVKLLHRSVPGPGGYAARNFGVSHSRGEWIALIDADDEWLSGHLQKIVESMRAYPSSEIFSSGWLFSNGIKSKLDPFSLKYNDRTTLTFTVRDYILGPRPICTNVLVTKRSLFDEVGGFNERWKHGADLEMWFRLLIATSAPAVWVAGPNAIYHLDASNRVTDSQTQIESPTAVYIRNSVIPTGKVPESLYNELLSFANKSSIRPFLRLSLQRRVTYCDIREYFNVTALTAGQYSLLCLFVAMPNLVQKCIAKKFL